MQYGLNAIWVKNPYIVKFNVKFRPKICNYSLRENLIFIMIISDSNQNSNTQNSGHDSLGVNKLYTSYHFIIFRKEFEKLKKKLSTNII